ncbi:hypothetical protein AAFF_G00017210 [Aldrovandia affinis]|uniref:Uncharacterized protein n=1 Tax=Aldrovandia affinis TaxID=143900 RepID=A0AAD7S5L8_9TELE|nr:hypothetical protein AAFF_G00017210 [Aldrovandia affinis]
MSSFFFHSESKNHKAKGLSQKTATAPTSLGLARADLVTDPQCISWVPGSPSWPGPPSCPGSRDRGPTAGGGRRLHLLCLPTAPIRPPSHTTDWPKRTPPHSPTPPSPSRAKRHEKDRQ